MKTLIPLYIMVILLYCGGCRSWQMNEYYSNYTGIPRYYGNNKRKYMEDKSRWYKLEMYNDGIFRMGEISGPRFLKFGTGRWHDCGDYIILVFNKYRQDREQEKLEGSLTGTVFIHNVCMVLKKKGRKDLKLLPSNALLRRSN